MKAFSTVAAAIAAGMMIVGCTVHQSEAPGLNGPSGLAMLLTVTATPDSISQNGGDQSTIRVTATGPNGEPLAGVPIRLQTTAEGVIADFGTLSAKNIVTGSNGVATAVFTAPPAPPAGTVIGTCQPNAQSPAVPGTCVSIVATATSTSFVTENPQTVTLRLVPPGTIVPLGKTPKAVFSFVPSSPQVQQQVVFDGQASCAETDSSGACLTTGSIVSYSWNFGDGSTGSGKTTTHSYTVSGTLPVTLTVTNSLGVAASSTQPITVGLPAGPTAKITFSPNPPAIGDRTFHFSGELSTSAPGHTIVQYSWEFGDGTPTAFGSGRNLDHTFPGIGTYTVNLSVFDDTGQRSVDSTTITIQ